MADLRWIWLFLMSGLTAQAGIIVLKNGKVLVCDGAYEVKGSYLHYRDQLGNLYQLPVKVVDLDRSTPEDPVAEEEERPKTAEEIRQEQHEAFMEMVDKTTDRTTHGRGENVEISNDVVREHKLTKGPTKVYSPMEQRELVGELFLALRRGDPVAFEEVLLKSVPLEGPIYGKMKLKTPLHFAAANGIPEAVALLAKAGANLNDRDENGDTPLLVALRGNSPAQRQIAHVLIEGGADVNVRTLQNIYPIHLALENADPAMVGNLLKHGAFPSIAHPVMLRPVFIAIAALDYRSLHLLTEEGADLAVLSKDGRSPLAEAILMDDPQCAHVLLEADGGKVIDGGVDFEPLVYAIERNKAKAAAFLWSRDEPGTSGKSRLLVAALTHGSLAAAAFLLEKGADPNAKTEAGDPVLVWAAGQSDLKAVYLLVEAGADVYAKGAEGLSAYASAKGIHRDQIRQILKAKFQ